MYPKNDPKDVSDVPGDRTPDLGILQIPILQEYRSCSRSSTPASCWRCTKKETVYDMQEWMDLQRKELKAGKGVPSASGSLKDILYLCSRSRNCRSRKIWPHVFLGPVKLRQAASLAGGQVVIADEGEIYD
jgi:hypothetical protein